MSTTEYLGTTPNVTLQPTVSATTVADGSPLSRSIPFFTAGFSVAMAALTFSLTVFQPLWLLSPMRFLLYVFAPVVVFIDAVVTLFIRLPYRSFLYLTDALFPLYVLCGVACITGGLFGLGARFFCQVLIRSVSEDSSLRAPREERKQESKGKVKREKVKFEG